MIGLKLTGEHDIFYRQERIGKGGKPFNLLKFATMLRNSPNMAGGFYTAENDPRILPMGRFLRKTKINELPQLLNILKGDMSVIGYRPQVKKQYDSYSNEVRSALAKSRPGLSGIGPIVFRSEEEILQQFKTHEERDEFYKNVITPYKGQLEVFIDNDHPVKPTGQDEPLGCRHFALRVDNLETTLSEQRIAHTDIGNDWQGIRYCYVNDPDGNQVELHE